MRQGILQQPGSYATLYDILTRLPRPSETFDATVLLVIDWDDANQASGVTLLDQPPTSNCQPVLLGSDQRSHGGHPDS